MANEKIAAADVNIEIIPYSSVDSSLVKKGKSKNGIARSKTEAPKYIDPSFRILISFLRVEFAYKGILAVVKY